MVRIILINHKRGAWQALVQRAVADIPKIDQVRSADRRQREPRTLHAHVSRVCRTFARSGVPQVRKDLQEMYGPFRAGPAPLHVIADKPHICARTCHIRAGTR
jgi:hypothetical protein